MTDLLGQLFDQRDPVFGQKVSVGPGHRVVDVAEVCVPWRLRQAFRLFWRRKSRAGRPTARDEVRRLIRKMASENPTWGAPQIHGELLKLEEFCRRVRSLGIRSVKTAVRPPKMTCFVERLIGTLRRELFDHVIVSSEAHARRLLREFQAWYNEDRVHLALAKDAPDHRPVETPEIGEVVSLPG